MSNGKSTWKYNKLLTARRNYFTGGGGMASDPKLDSYFASPSSQVSLNVTPNLDMNLASVTLPPRINTGQKFDMNTLGKLGTVGIAGANALASMISDINSQDVKDAANRSITEVNRSQAGITTGADSFDQLESDMANYSPIKYKTARDMGAKGGGQALGDAFSTAATGAAAGSVFGGIGAGIGAAVGALGSGIGSIIKNITANREAEKANKLITAANDFNERSFGNRADTLTTSQMQKLEANYAAFGGELNTQGADFTNGLLFIDNGGSHESNPFGGVLMGVDNEGTPNLVEEGETIFNDYVYSKRRKVPKDIRNKYKLGGPISFADASKKLAKESEERPNDPISQRGMQVLMSDLAIAQEQIKAKNQKGLFAYGGKVNKFSGNEPGTNQMNYDWNPFFTALSGYTTSKQKGQTTGKYKPDPYIPMKDNPYMLGATNIEALEGNDEYKAFTDAMIANPNMDYIRALDAGVAEGVPKLIGPDGNLVFNWANLFKGRRNDSIGGIYHWTPTMKSSTPAPEVTPKKSTERLEKNRYWLRGDHGTTPLGITPWEGYNDQGHTFEELYPGLKFRGKQKRDYDEATNTTFTDYYYDPIEEETQEKAPDVSSPEYEELPTWMRYAPVAGLGLGVLTDLSGLTNKPNYGNADAILEATRGAGNYLPVEASPIGNYLGYTPFDREFYINQMNAQAGATRRSIMQNAGLNRGAGMAALLASDYNTQGQFGQLARQAEEYNLAQRQQVEDFNRSTNMFNVEKALQADMANQSAQANMRDFNLRGTMAAAEMREKARLASDAPKSSNISGLINAIGDIGRENMAWNWRNFGLATGSFDNVGDKEAKLLTHTGKKKTKAKEEKTARNKQLLT